MFILFSSCCFYSSTIVYCYRTTVGCTVINTHKCSALSSFWQFSEYCLSSSVYFYLISSAILGSNYTACREQSGLVFSIFSSCTTGHHIYLVNTNRAIWITNSILTIFNSTKQTNFSLKHSKNWCTTNTFVIALTVATVFNFPVL